MPTDPTPVFPVGAKSVTKVDGSVLPVSTAAGGRELAPTIVQFGAGSSPDGAAFIPVPLGSGITWGYTSGTGAQTASVRMQRAFIERIVNAVNATASKELQLMIGGQPRASQGLSVAGQTRTYKQLVLLPTTSGDFIHDTMNFADRRYWWPRVSITKSYNIVRAATDQFVFFGRSIAQGGKGLAEADRYFTEWSVNTVNGQKKPWSALAIVMDILENFLLVPTSAIHVDPNIPGADPAIASTAYIPQNQQILGESADIVLGRFLRMAAADLYIGDEGDVYLYSTTHIRAVDVETNLLKDLKAYVKSGALNVIDLQATRPSVVVTQFEREYEMVFAYEETASILGDKVATTQAEAQSQINNRVIYLENVTRAVVNDQLSGFPRGAYIPLQAALAAFGQKYGSGPISVETFRRNWGYTGIAGMSLALTGANSNAYNDPLAAQIWQQMRNDYRTLFRFPAVVAERIKDVKPLLAGVLYPVTGTRAPAEVFGQVTWVADANIRTVDFKGNGILLNSATTTPQTPIPADVTTLDLNTGLVSVNWRDNLDKPGFLREVIPGQIDADMSPLMTSDGWASGYVATGDGTMPGFLGAYGLVGEWSLQVVASVSLQPIPGSPNPVTLGFPVGVADTGLGSAPSNAPSWTPPVSRIDTARYSIPASTTIGEFRNPASPAGDGAVNVGLLNRIAVEEAKRVYYQFVNALEGTVTYAWSAAALALRPRGHVSTVRHSVSPEGKLDIVVTAPPRRIAPELYNLLPYEVLKFTEKQIADTKIGVRGGV